MRAADTNILVRLMTGDDPAQVERAEAFTASGAWVSHVVLVETVWVLGSSYGLDHARIAQIIEMLLGHGQLVLQDSEVVAAALDHYKKRPAVGFSDCLVLEIARKAGHVPLGTFDRRLAGLPGAQQVP